MAIFTEQATLDIIEAINERRSMEDRTKMYLKNKWKFEPDKPGSYEGTITDRQGKKYHINTRPKKGTKTGANTGGNTENSKNSNINLGKEFFRLKGSNKNERKDAMLQHEIGHQNLHNINPKNKTVDPKNRTEEIFKNRVASYIKNSGGIDIESDEFIKKIINANYKGPNKPTVKMVRDEFYKSYGMEEYLKDSKNKDDQSRRNADYKLAKKFEKPNNPHLTAEEFEADRYAANRTSESALKKGIRQIYKQDAKNFNKKYDKINKNNPDKLKDKEERNKARRYEANQRTEDYEHRSKVLKNKDMRSAKTYK